MKASAPVAIESLSGDRGRCAIALVSSLGSGGDRGQIWASTNPPKTIMLRIFFTRGEADGVSGAVPPSSEQERAQLRMLGDDAIRGAVERYFGSKLAFHNCHRTAVFRPEAIDSPDYREFTSIRSQILNQTPDLVDC